MIVKRKTLRELDREKERGKKRYIERSIEDKEAKDEIKRYDRRETLPTKEHPKTMGIFNEV